MVPARCRGHPAAPSRLLLALIDALGTLGEVARVDALLTRAETVLAGDSAANSAADTGALRSLLLRQGRRLRASGRPGEAEAKLNAMAELTHAAGDEPDAAIAGGEIADILYRRGKLDEARRLQEEQLATNRQLGHVEGIASTLWGLAQLDLAQEKLEAAVPRIAEAYTIVRQLGRAEGIAAIGQLFGQILAAGGQREEGPELMRRSAAAYRRLGRDGDAAEVEASSRQIEDGAAD